MTYASFEDNAAAGGILSRFWTFLGRIGHAAFVSRGMEARMHKVQRLQAMSDAELEKLGLKRDDIATYVFRDIMYS